MGLSALSSPLGWPLNTGDGEMQPARRSNASISRYLAEGVLTAQILQ
jgi:hypothetical protein